MKLAKEKFVQVIKNVLLYSGLPRDILYEHSGILKHFSKNHSFILLSNVCLQFLGLVLFPIKTRMLGSENFGILILFATTPGFISAFIFLGLNTSVAKYIAESVKKGGAEEARNVTGIMLIYCFFAIVASAAISAPILMRVTSRPDLIKFYIVLLALTLSQNILVMFSRGMQRFKAIAIYPVCCHLLSFILILSCFLFYRINLSIVLGADCFAMFISCLYLASQNRDVLTVRIKFSFPLFREMLLFSLPLVMSMMFSKILIISDKYFIAYFTNLNSVGLYSAATRVGDITQLPLSPLTVILLPTLLHLFTNRKIQDIYILNAFIKKTLIIYTGYVTAIMVLFSAGVLRILTGYDFPNSNILMMIIGASLVLFNLQYIYAQPLLIKNNTKLIGKLCFVATVVNIVLNIVLIKLIGMIGASVATLFSIGTLFVLTYSYVQKRHSEFIPAVRLSEVNMVLFSSVVTICVSLVFWPVLNHSLGGVIAGFTLSSAVYCVLVVVCLRTRRYVPVVCRYLF